MFKAHDAGDKGWLTREDLACAFASLTGHEPSDAELDLVRGRCPRGEVDLRHFAAYMEDRLASRAASPAERCRAVFGAFDARRVGFITLTDALAAFALAAPRVPAVVVEDLFREADEDGDGRVGFDAFARVYFGADEWTFEGIPGR